MALYSPDPEALALLGAIPAKLSAAMPIPGHFERQPRFLAELTTGEVYIDSELQLDTDGWPDGRGKGDPSWQPDTSWSYKNDVAINANKVPYFVLPKGGWENNFDISLGDYAAVIFKKRIAFAVFADRGDETRLGEGSLELFRLLGEERLKPDGTIKNAGMGPGVITIIFPGSGPKKRFANQTELLTAISENGPALFTALGGIIRTAPAIE